MTSDAAARRLADVVVRQELTAFGELLTAVTDAAREPRVGSPMKADVEWDSLQSKKTYFGGIRSQAKADAGEFLAAARQHLDALQRMFEAPHLEVAAFGQVRAVHEALLPVMHLVDASATPRQRLVRAAAVRLHTAQESLVTLDGFLASDDAKQRAESALLGLLDWLERAGFVRKTHGVDERRTRELWLDDDREPLVPPSIALVKKHTPALAPTYTVTSGGAHSRLWLTQGLESTLASLVLATFFPLLRLSSYLNESLCAYLGADPRPHHEATHRRRLALMIMAGRPSPVWANYEDYLSSGG